LKTFQAIEREYTPAVHALYDAVVRKSEIKLELLPHEFFIEFARAFPGDCSLTVIRKDARIVAFNWGLLDGRTYHFIFCGIDYTLAEGDLYFNLMFNQFDLALRSGVPYVELGQTADSFKARLGSTPHPLVAYVKGTSAVARCVLAAGFKLIFPKPPPSPSFDVFKSTAKPDAKKKSLPNSPDSSPAIVAQPNPHRGTLFGARPTDLLHDAAIAALLAVILVVVRLGRLNQPRAVWTCWALLAIFMAGITFIGVFERKLPRWLAAISNFYPLVTIIWIYELLHWLVPAVSPVGRDGVLIAMDRAIFRCDPTVYLQRFSIPGLAAALYLCYASYYFIPVTLTLVLWNRNRIAARRFLFTVSACFFVLYIGYFLVPAQGPRATLYHSVSIQADPISRAISSLLDRLEGNKWDAFPSGHVMVTLYCLLFAYRNARRFFWIALPVGSLLIFSTVYCRYHYVVDVLAGAAVALLADGAERVAAHGRSKMR
jgi:membrane-associated phospholipid phosphatase